ncbi:hypothetical protein BDK51DRAFT_40142 [Blyttiomyces helicus]|uniref:Uncharacterized protein n=1 Tax=Blyttiomyces helicus TaxID=388810 RepID=A0A4P9W4U6_9FUNG|nr:hypothetical protein BDK51DRAFT_40142 [Blyttiomyces helicus]|eukprot:RKO87381.1 hypothetical protein BDK51DRAFT_40142 [Blyttiomyces helicus]
MLILPASSLPPSSFLHLPDPEFIEYNFRVTYTSPTSTRLRINSVTPSGSVSLPADSSASLDSRHGIFPLARGHNQWSDSEVPSAGWTGPLTAQSFEVTGTFEQDFTGSWSAECAASGAVDFGIKHIAAIGTWGTLDLKDIVVGFEGHLEMFTAPHPPRIPVVNIKYVARLVRPRLEIRVLDAGDRVRFHHSGSISDASLYRARGQMAFLEISHHSEERGEPALAAVRQALAQLVFFSELSIAAKDEMLELQAAELWKRAETLEELEELCCVRELVGEGSGRGECDAARAVRGLC